jgi:hypothetical protein
MDFIREYRSKKWDTTDTERAQAVDLMCKEIERVLRPVSEEKKAD